MREGRRLAAPPCMRLTGGSRPVLEYGSRISDPTLDLGGQITPFWRAQAAEDRIPKAALIGGSGAQQGFGCWPRSARRACATTRLDRLSGAGVFGRPVRVWALAVTFWALAVAGAGHMPVPAAVRGVAVPAEARVVAGPGRPHLGPAQRGQVLARHRRHALTACLPASRTGGVLSGATCCRCEEPGGSPLRSCSARIARRARRPGTAAGR